jgi:hypothetical protein
MLGDDPAHSERHASPTAACVLSTAPTHRSHLDCAVSGGGTLGRHFDVARSRLITAQGRATGSASTHPRRASCFAQSLRTIPCGIFAGYLAIESRFNQPIDWGLAP